MRIVQLVNGYSKGDGVGNVIIAVDKLLRERGYDTEICNQTLTFKDIDAPKFQKNNILLYHVALTVDPLVCYLKCKKILVFHNITDPKLLIGSGLQQMRNWCSAGLYDVRELSEFFEAAVCFSQYSKKTLMECGWNELKIFTLPIIVRFDKLSQKCSQEIIDKYADEKTNVVFMGRVFPNKKQEDIIYSFAKYREKYNAKARLFIIGSVGNTNYYNALVKLTQKLGIEENVIFTGRVSFNEYLAYYKIANVFLCMSAHEGFCIPIVEALYFEIPIIAVNSTAIPDTLGGSGVLVDSRDKDVVAEIINRVVSDRKYRDEIIVGERRRVNELQPKVLESLYFDVLQHIMSENVTTNLYKQIDKQQVLYDDISVPKDLIEMKNIIYGYGAAGGRLLAHLSSEGINVEAICDQNKAGIIEKNYVIISPDYAFKKYKNDNFIISIQDKKIIKSVISLMINNGLAEDNIYVYDELKDEIV